MISETNERYLKLERAFKADGFTITQKIFFGPGRIGIEARHDTASNYDTGQKKKSYYIEGTPYERGFLLGRLAEPEIADLAVNFADNIVFDFFGLDFLSGLPAAGDIIVSFVYELSRKTWASQPPHIHEELSGMIDGCNAANRGTKATKERLIAVNMGFDVLCALIYSGEFENIIPNLLPENIFLPMLCNAFSVFGSAAFGGHFFGRDFMFTSGSVLQNDLAHIVTLPISGNGEKAYPFISMTAPGLIGSASAMNTAGVAGGLNMSPAANCDADDIGFNSLLLLRECIMLGGSAHESADVIQNAKRGVTWNYVLSDGRNDTACTAEAGASQDNIDFLSYPPKNLLPYLPGERFLKSNVFAPVRNGCAVRWCSAPIPDSYMKFNYSLWRHYNASHDPKIKLYSDAFAREGYINRTPNEMNCPESYYFAPRRTGKDVHITTNSFLIPQMRLCAMRPWTAAIASGYTNDIQWRYDELNHQIRQEIYDKGGIGYGAAKRLVEFLAPYGKFPKYYGKNPKSRDGKETRIEGCTTLFDLKRMTAESHYGYYCDEWVKTTLPNYF